MVTISLSVSRQRPTTGGVNTLNATAFEVPPPGGAVVTATFSDSGVVRIDAGTVTLNCVALTNEVGGCVPPKATVDAGMKFAPDTVTVTDPEPAITLDGASEKMLGGGLSPVTGIPRLHMLRPCVAARNVLLGW
jgi:hypothetical protein